MQAEGRLDQVIYREASEADLPVIEGMYGEYDAHLRQFNYAFPRVENMGRKWVDTFRRTLGRFSMIYVAEHESQLRLVTCTVRGDMLPSGFGGPLLLCDLHARLPSQVIGSYPHAPRCSMRGGFQHDPAVGQYRGPL